jgi:hypothetical protein
VTTQARVVLDAWQKIHENPAQASGFRDEFSGPQTSWSVMPSALKCNSTATRAVRYSI